jgi:hypothetical protein
MELGARSARQARASAAQRLGAVAGAARRGVCDARARPERELADGASGSRLDGADDAGATERGDDQGAPPAARPGPVVGRAGERGGARAGHDVVPGRDARGAVRGPGGAGGGGAGGVVAAHGGSGRRGGGERAGRDRAARAAGRGAWRLAAGAQYGQRLCVHESCAGRAAGPAETGLGKGAVLPCVEAAARALWAAQERLNGGRLRESLGWRTARQADESEPWWYRGRDREEVYRTACAARKKAVLGCRTARARRAAEREAIYATLEDCGLVTRTRGGVQLPVRKAEGIT